MAQGQAGGSQSLPKGFALVYETGTAGMLLREGLGHLQRLHHETHGYHLPLVLLSLGFERLMKVVLCLGRKEFEHEWPNPSAWGHHILCMLAKISERLESGEYEVLLQSRDAAISDLTNEAAQGFLGLLEEFAASSGRYFHLNIISGGAKKKDADWIESEWTQKTIRLGHGAGPTFYRISGAREVVIALERAARALSLVLLGIASRLGGAEIYEDRLLPFPQLTDESLGCTCYHLGRTEHGAWRGTS